MSSKSTQLFRIAIAVFICANRLFTQRIWTKLVKSPTENDVKTSLNIAPHRLWYFHWECCITGSSIFKDFLLLLDLLLHNEDNIIFALKSAIQLAHDEHNKLDADSDSIFIYSSIEIARKDWANRTSEENEAFFLAKRWAFKPSTQKEIGRNFYEFELFRITKEIEWNGKYSRNLLILSETKKRTLLYSELEIFEIHC